MRSEVLKKMQLPPWSDDREIREEAIRAMQANAMQLDPGLIKKLRRSCKERYARMNLDVTVSTWTLANCLVEYDESAGRIPSARLSSKTTGFKEERLSSKAGQHQPLLIKVMLQELFPALEGARELERSAQGTLKRELQVLCETARHGRVIVLCAGMEEGDTLTLVGKCLHLYAGNSASRTNSKIIFGGVCVSLVYQRTSCLACGKDDTGPCGTGASTKENIRLLRCSRCWETLRAPAWYCSAACQKADYSLHKLECGKIG